MLVPHRPFALLSSPNLDHSRSALQELARALDVRIGKIMELPIDVAHPRFAIDGATPDETLGMLLADSGHFLNG